jgi:DNA-directed RNA polymerase beta' subunit
MNRQPTLSYQSMLSFRVKVREDDIKTIGIHPSVTQTFNADFDGDEMNLFVFPQNSDVKDLLITNFPECIRKIQDEKTSEYLGLNSYEELDRYGLTVKLSDIARKNVENTSLEIMMKSGAKGSSKNLEQMMNCIGDQYVYGKRVGHIANSYYSGMDPEEYFIHQMASREGIVVQGVTTSDTGYLNRKGCHVFADVVKYPNGVVRDNYGVLRF